MKALSARESEEMRSRSKDALNDEEEVEHVSCWKLIWLNKYVQSPNKLFMILWNFLALSMNTVSIFIVFYEFAYHLTARENDSNIVLFIEFVLFFDIIAYFFKALPSKDSPRGFICSLLGMCGLCKKKCRFKAISSKAGSDTSINNQYNTDFKQVSVHYLTGMFTIDVLSVIPFLMAKLAAGDVKYKELLERDYMTVFAYLRLLRITQIPKILNASEVYSLILMQKFPSRRQVIFNSKQIFSLILFLTLALHLGACVNIYQGMMKGGWI